MTRISSAEGISEPSEVSLTDNGAAKFAWNISQCALRHISIRVRELDCEVLRIQMNLSTSPEDNAQLSSFGCQHEFKMKLLTSTVNLIAKQTQSINSTKNESKSNKLNESK